MDYLTLFVRALLAQGIDAMTVQDALEKAQRDLYNPDLQNAKYLIQYARRKAMEDK